MTVDEELCQSEPLSMSVLLNCLTGITSRVHTLIADMAVYPWVNRYEWHKTDIDRFPEVKRWYKAIGELPGVVCA